MFYQSVDCNLCCFVYIISIYGVYGMCQAQQHIFGLCIQDFFKIQIKENRRISKSNQCSTIFRSYKVSFCRQIGIMRHLKIIEEITDRIIKKNIKIKCCGRHIMLFNYYNKCMHIYIYIKTRKRIFETIKLLIIKLLK